MTARRWRQTGLDLLLAVLRDRKRLAGLGEEQWDSFLPAAHRAKLLPRIAIDAAQSGLTSGAPGWARDRLTEAAVRGRQFEREVRWEIDRIHRALMPIGIKPVFLKGAAYIAAGLASGVGRVVADVDILVSETHLAAVEKALIEHGWEFDKLEPYDERYYRDWMHELPPMRHKQRGTMLDVHYGILPRIGRIPSPREQLLEHAVEVRGVRVLSPEHLVLHSSAHLFQDWAAEATLRDALDLRDMLEHFDCPRFNGQLVPQAEALGLETSLYYGILSAKLVGLAAAPEVTEWRPARALNPITTPVVNVCVTRALTKASRMSAWALFVRAHWLRMPLVTLFRHVARKAISPTVSWVKKVSRASD